MRTDIDRKLGTYNRANADKGHRYLCIQTEHVNTLVNKKSYPRGIVLSTFAFVKAILLVTSMLIIRIQGMPYGI